MKLKRNRTVNIKDPRRRRSVGVVSPCSDRNAEEKIKVDKFHKIIMRNEKRRWMRTLVAVRSTVTVGRNRYGNCFFIDACCFLWWCWLSFFVFFFSSGRRHDSQRVGSRHFNHELKIIIVSVRVLQNWVDLGSLYWLWWLSFDYVQWAVLPPFPGTPPPLFQILASVTYHVGARECGFAIRLVVYY